MYSKKIMQHGTKPKNVGEIKNASGIGEVGNMKCVLPNQKIFLNDEFEEIRKYNKNDYTLSHNGLSHKILDGYIKSYNGKIVTLKNNFGEISLTNDHLVFALKLPEHYQYFRTKNKRKLIPAWYHADQLRIRDIVLYPISKEVKDAKYLKFDIPKLKWDFKSKEIPKKIPLNKDFLRLCGYFLAEGHISEGKSRNYITLAFHKKEKEYVEDVRKIVKKIFNLDVTVRFNESKNLVVVYIYSAGLSRFFKKLFNKGAENKRIHNFFMKLPLKKQEALLEGLWKGDGYVNLLRKGPRAGYATISYQLAQQIKILLIRQKIVPSIYVDKEKEVKGVKHKEAYRIHVGQRSSLKKLCELLKIRYSPKSYESVASWFDNDFLYTPLTKVIKKKYNGKVYNLEVENSHSFVSESFCLHNCGDIMKVFIKVKDGKINKIKFLTFGCVAAIASSDALCDLAKGKTLEKAKKITNKDIIKYLGGEVPAIKVHCSVLGQEALRKAIEDYESKKK